MTFQLYVNGLPIEAYRRQQPRTVVVTGNPRDVLTTTVALVVLQWLMDGAPPEPPSAEEALE